MKRRLLLLLFGLLATGLAQGQFQIQGGTFNHLYNSDKTAQNDPGIPVDPDGTPPVVTPQFAGKGESSASSGPISDNTSDYYDRYPAGKQVSGVTVTGGIVLLRSGFGGVFASGVPRYSLGDEIERPALASNGVGSVDLSYWRTKPVDYGEVITQPGGALVTPLPNPNAPGEAPAHAYYYSPHANKVFAHQSGRVSIKWMTAQPVDANGNPDPAGAFRFKDEIFNVSSGTSRPVQRIYWTERTFNAPRVNIPTGRIVAVNPVYNQFFPEKVGEEYEAVGQVPADPDATPPEELRTLWFENTAGLGQLRAYNQEGRILVEYLGALQSGSGGVHEFLGADVVEVVQVADPTTVTVHLGEQLEPHDLSNRIPDNADFLLPSSVLNLGQDGITYYGTSARPDGQLIYHAEWENDNPDKVVFYWLERNDAAIHFLDPPGAPNLEIAWPLYLNKYLQVWPDSLSEYAGVTAGELGNPAETGVQFNGGTIPEVVFQDDGAQSEAGIDLATQRLVADLSASSDQTNRSLLKFGNGNGVWYVRAFIQSQSVLGSPYLPDPDGPGPLTETLAVHTLSDLDADGVRDLIDTTAVVGGRIERPGDLDAEGEPVYELAGFIAEGTNYLPEAYQDPFLEGVEAAGAGAIIPVNAIPGANQFTIWWFKKVEPPDASFEAFYVPAKSGRYTVSWPATSNPSGPNQDQIVLASNAGSGDLASFQAAGKIYEQNSPTLPGYNPNEEHAQLLTGRAYAMRDDLNVTPGPNYTSEPFVLVFYTDPADSRPAVRTFEVLREIDLNDDDFEDPGDILFNYPVTAGATVPAPMPLPLLPLPIDADGNVPNREVDGVPDPAPDRSGPVALYDEFTYQDRKGFTKVYRGPHDGGNPTMGMQFYYLMKNGYFIPGLDPQPEAGTVLPYLRPENVTGTLDLNGDPLTIIYRPVWPDAVPELRIGETLTLPKFGLPQVRGQSSAEVLYEQSIAVDGTAKPSVTLHDPTRAKKVALSSQGLEEIPESIATTNYQGRTYFQRLAPHLQPRVYVNRDLDLVLEGEFVDEIAGEDYLHLNVLSAEDVDALKGLAVDAPSPEKGSWESAIDALSTTVETFVEDPARKGTFTVGSSDPVNGTSLAIISDSDTAVDSYALTATGAAAGYVSLLFGDGINPGQQGQGEPVSITIVKVVPKLYVGDMKVQFSSNPLDEQVSLRHSGDFAARPDDYEFEWRYSPGGAIPPIYNYGSPVAVLNNGTTWRQIQNPGTAQESESPSVGVPRSLTIYDADHGGGDLPGVLMQSNPEVDFSGGLPGQIIFSADLSNDLDGLVLYVNGNAALAFRAPDPFVNSDPVPGLSATGLPSQFEINTNYFSAGLNEIEVALYSTADPLLTSSVNFRLETVTKQDRVDPAVFPASPWQQPNGVLLNQITLGGSPTAPLGDPLLLMQDNSFTVRYRPKLSSGGILTEGKATQENVEWSDWMEPKSIPGWVKRVLDGINPFNQRVTDLFNNAVNTDVSILTQAGTRWEGDIALNLDNINDQGLIAIYETVLNRAKLFTIDNGYDTPGTNDALLLAAGYLNDLYVILGNEAFADAANPTISLDDQDTVTEVSSSRFSFEGQVPSVLEEELALLRGRDDFFSTKVDQAPAYNRLYWNYTNGIEAGEVLYAVNYNIKEKAGSSTANGIIDAADAQRMFPQAHGDAYGHYLTALTGYYKLLTNSNFTWTPRSETVLVLNQNVEVDYFDERKFAGAAADLARTAEQILSLTARQTYQDDPAAGWAHLRDNKLNTQTNRARQWGVDEWASRATQGSYLNWVVGNAMLLDEDLDPDHAGIRKVDRSTVPELTEVAAAGGTLQGILDSANARLNPLGLSPDAIAFDISPADLKAGHSHFEQVYDRALRSVLNAKGSFDQAGRMTGLLRTQENQLDDFNTAIEEQERAFGYQLSGLYGTPYSSDIGPGETYAQGYNGPDLLHYFLVDKNPGSELFDATELVELEILDPVEVPAFVGIGNLADFNNNFVNPLPGDEALWETERITVTVAPNRVAQFASDFMGADPGSRAVTGEIQTALADALQAQYLLADALEALENKTAEYRRAHRLFSELVELHNNSLSKEIASSEQIAANTKLKRNLEISALVLDGVADTVNDFAGGLAEALPTSVGFSNDVTSPARAGIIVAAVAVAQVSRLAAAGLNAGAVAIDNDILNLEILRDRELAILGFDFEQRQFIHEVQILRIELQDEMDPIYLQATALQHSTQKVANLLARGDRIQAERQIFRQRAAAVVQGFRTKDVAFRTFRNEALEQYRTLYDLASRYTYLAAKSYDYETGLLGTPEGQRVLNRIVSSRALGDLTGGQPQATVSTFGDAGLAGTMAQLVADFSVAEGRLGINNPDENGTLFSLRHELFRLLKDPNITSDDAAWQQTLEQHIVSDLMADPDAATYCRNLRRADGSRVPGIVIPFSTTIRQGYNWFGLPLAGGDHNFSASNFATKIYAAGIVLEGYVGMDTFATGILDAGNPATADPDSLAATPYMYLIPTGTDFLRAPPLGDSDTIRAWDVADQALPLPYNLGANNFNGTQFFGANGTLSEQPWIQRKHQAFRPVDDPAYFYSWIPNDFVSARLVGRSVWNSGWKIVIPAYSLLNDEEEGLERFVRSVDDIKIFLRTYSNSGN